MTSSIDKRIVELEKELPNEYIAKAKKELPIGGYVPSVYFRLLKKQYELYMGLKNLQD